MTQQTNDIRHELDNPLAKQFPLLAAAYRRAKISEEAAANMSAWIGLSPYQTLWSGCTITLLLTLLLLMVSVDFHWIAFSVLLIAALFQTILMLKNSGAKKASACCMDYFFALRLGIAKALRDFPEGELRSRINKLDLDARQKMEKRIELVKHLCLNHAYICLEDNPSEIKITQVLNFMFSADGEVEDLLWYWRAYAVLAKLARASFETQRKLQLELEAL